MNEEPRANVTCEHYLSLLQESVLRDLSFDEEEALFVHEGECPTHSLQGVLKSLPDGAFEHGAPEHGIPPQAQRVERCRRDIRRYARRIVSIEKVQRSRSVGTIGNGRRVCVGSGPLEVAFNIQKLLGQAGQAAAATLVASPRRLQPGQVNAAEIVELGRSTSVKDYLLLRHLRDRVVRAEEHVEFLQGCRLGKCFEFGKIGNGLRDLADLCTKRFLSEMKASRVDCVVGHTLTMYEVAKEMAKGLGIERRAIPAFDDDERGITLMEGEQIGPRVGLLVDVVLTGDTLERLAQTLSNDYGAEVVFVGCLVNQGYAGDFAKKLSFLWFDEESAEYKQPCPRCQNGELPVSFDHAFGLAIEKKPLHRLREELDESRAQHAHWWNWIEDTGAFKQKKEQEKIYDFFIRVDKLLAHEEICRRIVRDAAEELEGFGSGRWVIAHLRSARQTLLAKLLSKQLGCERVEVEATKGCVRVLTGSHSDFESRSVLFLDAAVNSGRTVTAMVRLFRNLGAKEVAAFVLINRLPNDNATRLVDRLLDRPLRYLFSFPFPAVMTGTKRLEDLRALNERGLRVLRTGEAASEMKPPTTTEIMRMIPASWYAYPHARQALCALACCDIGPRTLREVCLSLVSMDCFDWFNYDWLSSRRKLLEREGRGCGFLFQVCRRAKEDQSVCKKLKEALGTLVGEGALNARARRRCHKLERILAGESEGGGE